MDFDWQQHYRSLENMYLAAPINRFFQPRVHIEEGRSEIVMDVGEHLYHAAGAAHGSCYFKMLDDAAFFAANSLENEVFVLTASFTTYLTRPVSEGLIKSVGQVVNRTRTQFICEAIAYNADGKEIGRGNGIFVRGKTGLASLDCYRP